MKIKSKFLTCINVFIVLDAILLCYFIFGSAQLLKYRYGDGATVATILTYLLPTLLMSLPLLMMLIISRYFVIESLKRKAQIANTAEVEVVKEEVVEEEVVEDNQSDEEVLKEKIEAIKNEEEPQVEEIREELEQIDERKEENKEEDK